MRSFRGRWSWIPDSRLRGFRNDQLLVLQSLHSVLVERRLHAAAIELQRALGADRVGALEDPVLPRAQPAENLRFHRLRTGETQVSLHARESIGANDDALLHHHSHLVVAL